MDIPLQNRILKGLVELTVQAHETSKTFGYWEKERSLNDVLLQVHKELSDAFSAMAAPDARSEKIKQFTKLEEHLADTIIRIADAAGGMELRIAGAVLAKMRYNEKLAALNKKNRDL